MLESGIIHSGQVMKCVCFLYVCTHGRYVWVYVCMRHGATVYRMQPCILHPYYRLHSTRGQFFIRHECGACMRLRTNTSLLRMISRSAYGFSIFVITCLHTSDERVQTLYTSCIRIVSNPFSVLHT